MKNKFTSKLDNLIIKLLGQPGVIQEEQPEPSIDETFQYFGDLIESNKKSIYFVLIVIVTVNIITNLIFN